MVQKINPHPALGHNRNPPYYVFSKDTILGSVPSISSEVLGLSSSVHAEKLQVSAALCCKILRYTLLQNGLNVCRIVFFRFTLKIKCFMFMNGRKKNMKRQSFWMITTSKALTTSRTLSASITSTVLMSALASSTFWALHTLKHLNNLIDLNKVTNLGTLACTLKPHRDTFGSLSLLIELPRR